MSSSRMHYNWWLESKNNQENKVQKLARMYRSSPFVVYNDPTVGDFTFNYPGAFHSFERVNSLDKDRLTSKHNNVYLISSPFIFNRESNNGILAPNISGANTQEATQRGTGINNLYMLNTLHSDLSHDYPKKFFNSDLTKDPLIMQIYSTNDNEHHSLYPSKHNTEIFYHSNNLYQDETEKDALKHYIIRSLANRVGEMLNTTHFVPAADIIRDHEHDFKDILHDPTLLSYSPKHQNAGLIAIALDKLHHEYDNLNDNRPTDFTDYIQQVANNEKNPHRKLFYNTLLGGLLGNK